MYDKAITSFYKAAEYEEAMPYAQYGLGTVYYDLGEVQASLSGFSESLELIDVKAPEQQELLYRIHYNTGITLFGEGDFSGAANSFREALKANDKKIDAKRNLELSLLSQERQNDSSDRSSPGEGENAGKAALFEFIYQRELGQWKSRDWSEDETGWPDY